MEMLSLDERRENLFKTFAKKNVNNAVMKSKFVSNTKTHIMRTCDPETYEVTFAHKQRL